MKIFCDLDGKLLDVSSRHYRVYAELIKKYDGQPLSKEQYWSLKRKKTPWPDLLSRSRVDVRNLNPFLDNFIERIEDPEYLKMDTLFAGVDEVLQYLSSSYMCYLVSLRRKPDILLKQVEWLGIDRYFTKIVSGHSENDGYDVKIELIKGQLGEDKGTIIGDTEADIITGKKLGLATIAVQSGIRDKDYLNALEPDYLISSFSNIIELGLL